ncbi:hypothetical protein RclHR1_06910006 [Rhizophagus clarus]|uniref:Uncharacterized protein n=1 Tax=Rhizophagus clarus TaxID=94130 RepID=A0A2Z6SK47_9GLOM|nr:hypothetical protein RclHR1_06910006 [Rhizophagus clarus]GES94519.1 hypothetical protein RCL_e23985_RclHR1_06910006 [Rhizophagus clarus]
MPIQSTRWPEFRSYALARDSINVSNVQQGCHGSMGHGRGLWMFGTGQSASVSGYFTVPDTLSKKYENKDEAESLHLSSKR